MTDAVAIWSTMTGRRLTTGQSLNVAVEAYTVNRATEGNVAQVIFSLTNAEAGVETEVVVSTPGLHVPDFGEAVSPITGTTTWAPSPGYGFTFASADYEQGRWEIQATVISDAGTSTALDSIVIYNEKAGDSRPCKKTIYVDPVGGANGNPGTLALPVRDIQAGVNLCHTGGDMGGGTVILMPGEHKWAGSGSTTNFTSDHWWLTLRAQSGATIIRDGYVVPSNGQIFNNAGSHYLSMAQGRTSGSCRIWLVIEGTDLTLPHGDMKVNIPNAVFGHYVVEGGSSGHPRGKTVDYSVQFSDGHGELFDALGNTNVKRHAFCHTRVGVVDGFTGYTEVRDCVVERCQGLASQVSGSEPFQSLRNVIVQKQRYDYEVLGKIDSVVGSKVSVTAVAGTMVIQQLAATTIFAIEGGSVSSNSIDLATMAGELIDSPRWGVICTGFTNSGNNSPVRIAGTVGSGGRYQPFQVLASGYVGGLSYLVLDNASAVNEATAGSGAQLWTGLWPDVSTGADTGATYVERTHPDVNQILVQPSNFTLFSGVAIRDWTGGQIWFPSTIPVSRWVMVNCGGGDSSQRSNFTGITSMSDCLFLHCDFVGAFNVNSGATFDRNEIQSCVFGTATNLPTTGTNVVAQCHFISGSTFGSNASSGTWFAKDPDEDPWELTPEAFDDATANGFYIPIEWYWDGATLPTRGVWSNVGLFDWSVAAGSQDTPDAATSSLVTVDPTVDGGIAVVDTPASSDAVFTTVDPTYLEETVAEITPDAISASLTTVDPLVLITTDQTSNSTKRPNQGGSTGGGREPRVAFRTLGMMARYGLGRFRPHK